MTTLRIRGLYAAALTALFRQHPSVWEIVQPDDEIRPRLPQPWRMDSPDVDIDDQPDARGTRDTIRIVGPGHAVKQAVQLLQQQCIDVITHQSSSPVGAIYMGLVGLVSRARRRAVVYLGEQRVGILPLGYEDRDVPVGSYIPVRIEALSAENDTRPQLSAVLTVPGHYAVLTMAPTVRISKQITDAEARERLQRLGEAQDTGGWGIIWRTAAQEAADEVLAAEIHSLVQESQALRESLAKVTTLGYVYGGEVSTQMCLPGYAQTVCDHLRAELLPTLPGHHKYKAQRDMYGATVDALEKELPPDLLQARTATLGVLASLDAMRAPIHDTLRLLVRTLDGTRAPGGEVERLAYDLHAGWVEVHQALRSKDSYPPDFRIDKQPGDYTITRFQEGSWNYITRFYSRDKQWKGDYACLTTPVAVFADQLHVTDLRVTVRHSPQHTLELSGIETLQELHKQDIVTEALMQKVEEEGAALLRQLGQESSAAGPASPSAP
jgi:hypothetical protein